MRWWALFGAAGTLSVSLCVVVGYYTMLDTRLDQLSPETDTDTTVSTIHKAKGLECDSVVVMPCDAATFSGKNDARCLLYVALSRAKKRLMLVLSKDKPSPLFKI